MTTAKILCALGIIAGANPDNLHAQADQEPRSPSLQGVWQICFGRPREQSSRDPAKPDWIPGYIALVESQNPARPWLNVGIPTHHGLYQADLRAFGVEIFPPGPMLLAGARVGAADSLRVVLNPVADHGPLVLQGRLMGEVAEGMWFQAAFAGGKQGRFTMRRIQMEDLPPSDPMEARGDANGRCEQDPGNQNPILRGVQATGPLIVDDRSVTWQEPVVDRRSVVSPAARTITYLPHLERCGGSALDGVTEGWTPAREDAGRVDTRVRRALHDALGSDSILDSEDYLFQYFGVLVGGRRVIFVNGFHPIVVRSFLGNMDAWKHEPVVVCDVGRAGFQTEYDVGSGTLSPLRFDPGYLDRSERYDSALARRRPGAYLAPTEPDAENQHGSAH